MFYLMVFVSVIPLLWAPARAEGRDAVAVKIESPSGGIAYRGKPFSLSIRIEGPFSSTRYIRWKRIKHFKVAKRKLLKREKVAIFIGNSRRFLYKFSYSIILFPRREGEFEIVPLEIRWRGKRVVPEPFEVRVLAKSSNINRYLKSDFPFAANCRVQWDEVSFPRRPRLYFHFCPPMEGRTQGEPVILNIYLLGRERLNLAPAGLPQFNGAHLEVIRELKILEFHNTIFKNRKRGVSALLFQVKLFPLEKTFSIEPWKIRYQREFSSRWEIVESRRMNFQLSPLPVPPPEAAKYFPNNAAGELKFHFSFQPAELTTGQIATLKLCARGVANHRLFKFPPVKLKGLSTATVRRQVIPFSDGKRPFVGEVCEVRFVKFERPGQFELVLPPVWTFDLIEKRFKTHVAPKFTARVTGKPLGRTRSRKGDGRGKPPNADGRGRVDGEGRAGRDGFALLWFFSGLIGGIALTLLASALGFKSFSLFVVKNSKKKRNISLEKFNKSIRNWYKNGGEVRQLEELCHRFLVNYFDEKHLYSLDLETLKRNLPAVGEGETRAILSALEMMKFAQLIKYAPDSERENLLRKLRDRVREWR